MKDKGAKYLYLELVDKSDRLYAVLGFAYYNFSGDPYFESLNKSNKSN